MRYSRSPVKSTVKATRELSGLTVQEPSWYCCGWTAASAPTSSTISSCAPGASLRRTMHWVLRLLGEAVLIDIAVKGCRDACILLRLARLQFCGKLIYQRLDGFKSRVRIVIFRIEIRDDARALAIAQPVVVIDAYTAKRFERLRYNRCDRGGVSRRFKRVVRTESQSACERNRSRSREAKREKPSSGKPAHENFDTPGWR